VRWPLLVLLVLLLPSSAAAGDRELLKARDAHLPAAQRSYGVDPDGLQARYDAGRDLVEAVRAAGPPSAGCRRLRDQLRALGSAQVRFAEAFDHPVRFVPPALPRVTARCTPGRSRAARPPPALHPDLPAVSRAVAPRRTNAPLAARLARIGAGFHGWAGFWTHDLSTGSTAGWNSDARFPAASTVKLGVIQAALDRSGDRPERSPRWYDLLQIGAWSSNLAANRLATRLGYPAVEGGLRRLGMTSSTYPGGYRAGTARAVDAPNQPPHRHTRLTTARDLGRALYRLQAAALGNRTALRQTALTRHQARLALSLLLDPERGGGNLGLLRPWLGSMRVVEKNGWLSDTRITAAILYRPAGATIVVVEAYRPDLRRDEATALGRHVLREILTR
jgi:hypothetical protein